jgi:hypothetical protein
MATMQGYMAPTAPAMVANGANQGVLTYPVPPANEAQIDKVNRERRTKRAFLTSIKHTTHRRARLFLRRIRVLRLRVCLLRVWPAIAARRSSRRSSIRSRNTACSGPKCARTAPSARTLSFNCTFHQYCSFHSSIQLRAILTDETKKKKKKKKNYFFFFGFLLFSIFSSNFFFI